MPTAKTAVIASSRLRRLLGAAVTGAGAALFGEVLLSMVFPSGILGVVAAAQGAGEVCRGGQLARGEIGFEVALAQHLRLGAQHLQVVAEALAVAEQGEL